MTSAVRLFVLTAAVAATLAACNRKEAEAPAAPPAEASAEASAPYDYESKNQFAEVSLKLPETLKATPELHAVLYRDEVGKLRQYIEGAQSDRTEAGFETAMGPYQKSIDYGLAAETTRLLSLQRSDFDYSGGAHPNTVQTGLLWDRELKRQITSRELFSAGADFRALNRALCNAVNVAKKARNSDAETVTATGDLWTCPDAAKTPFVLTPSTTAGKAGGLTFLIDPYLVGPYAEGGYEIAIPQSVFISLIAPAYASEFAGAPVKTGDVSPAAAG